MKPPGSVQVYVAPGMVGVERWIVPPAQTGLLLPAVGVAGVGITVTEPDAAPTPFALQTVATEYVVVTLGFTIRVTGLVVTRSWVNPSDHVTFHGPIPVRSAEICTDWPEQMVPPPVTVAVTGGAEVMLARVNSVPRSDAPPFRVVPYRFPELSSVSPPVGSLPSEGSPAKTCRRANPVPSVFSVKTGALAIP